MSGAGTSRRGAHRGGPPTAARRTPASSGARRRPRRGAVSLVALARRRRRARHRSGGRAGAAARAEGRPRRARPGLHPRHAARGCGCSRASTSAPRCAASSASPRTGPVLLVGNHSGGNMTVDTGRLHARLQHLLRRRAALLPAGPQPGAVDAGARLPAQVRHRGRQPRQRRQGARVRRRAARLPGRRLRGAPARPGSPARVDFDGRKGFLRLALKHDVPIVPVVSVGGQETALFLTRGEGLARLLRLDRMFRLKVLPISLALPWVPERGRHARPRAAAGQDHDRRARADRPARGVRRGAGPRTRSTPRCWAACRRPSRRSRRNGACRCSADARRAHAHDRRAARADLGARARPGRLPAVHGRRHALRVEGARRSGRRRRAPARARAGPRLALLACACAWARRTWAAWWRWSSSTSPATSAGPTSRASTSAGAGACARPRTAARA